MASEKMENTVSEKMENTASEKKSVFRQQPPPLKVGKRWKANFDRVEENSGSTHFCHIGRVGHLDKVSQLSPSSPDALIPSSPDALDPSSPLYSPSPQHDPDATLVLEVDGVRVFLGAIEHSESEELMSEKDIRAVACIMPQDPHFRETEVGKSMEFLHIPIKDCPDVNIAEHFDTFIQFIDKCVHERRNVLVHCWAGVSRSASMITAYIIKKQNKSFSEAFHALKSKRGQIDPNAGFIILLKKYEEKCRK